MKITKQQELDHIVSITAGLLASGDFTYTRRDNNGAVVHSDLIDAAGDVWGNIKRVAKVEISDENAEASLASSSSGTLASAESNPSRQNLATAPKPEARKGKEK